ncbi:hypothetical protein [Fictibacillus barbaricus]|uniref:DUF4025 domain-containing protein n=1 Tax=Fictibacillus barbaricus TaxID=182136 RepID=A0ABS2ZAB1_9BACL|nr:hypothetical protein [Fictibacillus barbaricus]MBN3544371.1 hypothetical protein [Fictibacillus barbaricus]GGB67366.1 hypothetical protein GCM10007199_36930 [Fictibacillus barbaricus]
MKEKEEQIDQETSDGMNELVEIINAKGDTGELEEIADKYDSEKNHSPLCDDNFFYADLRAIAEDGAKEE